MDHTDHVYLLRDAGILPGQLWADLGAGTGAFTLAAVELMGRRGEIYTVDRNADALQQLTGTMHARFPKAVVHPLAADFSDPIDLPLLDGVIMANSLHFIKDKLPVLERVKGYLRPGGRLALVEYNTDTGNQWVPYPFSFRTWTALAAQAGFEQTRQIGVHPSRFLREIYSAVSW